MQIKDRMEIIQSLLNSQPGIYQDQAILTSLLGMLGLSTKSLDLDLRIAHCAMKQRDIDKAAEKCTLLVNANYKAAWELCAQVVVSDKRGGLTEAAERQLLGFVLAHCHEDQVRQHSDCSCLLNCPHIMIT